MSVASGPRTVARPGPANRRPTGSPQDRATTIAGLRQAAGTTPGRLGLIMVGLVVLSVVTGVIGLISIQGRADTLDDLTAHREPFRAAAQQIYRSLSDADATAASAFLSGAVEPPELRARYQADIARAGAALGVAATDISGVPDAAGPLSDLATGIPTYTGLVERASANNQQAFPVGSAYLREADHLMQGTLLPAAQALYTVNTNRLAAAQDDATSFPWAAVLLVVALLVALVLTQRYLRRRTNRVINVGLLVATIAVVIAVLWSGTAIILEGTHVSAGRSNGSAQVDVLAQARTKALQARTDELLNLIARGGADYETPFRDLAAQVGGASGNGGLLAQAHAASSDPALTTHLDAAIAAARDWFTLHTTASDANKAGDYPTAVATTLGTGAAGRNEATVFDKLDNALAAATDQARGTFASETGTASAWLTALPIGVLVLLVVAGVGAAVGIWQRLREYR